MWKAVGFVVLLTLFLLVVVAVSYRGGLVAKNLHIYVDSRNGNDCNDGKTKCTAVKTLRQALELVFQYGWDCSATVHLLPGKHCVDQDAITLSNATQGLQRFAVTIKGESTTNLLTSATITSVMLDGPAQLLKVKLNTTVLNDDVQGAIMLFTKEGRSILIGSVDDATKEITLAVTGFVPKVGDNVKIVLPSSTVKFRQGVYFTATYPVIFENLNFELNDVVKSFDNTVIFGTGAYGFESVRFLGPTEVGKVALVIFENNGVTTGTLDNVLPGFLSSNGNTAGIAFIGSHLTPTLVVLEVNCSAFYVQESVFANAILLCASGVTNLTQSSLFQSYVVQFEMATLTAVNVKLLNTPAAGFGLQDNSNLTISFSDISGARGGGIVLQNSTATISNVTTDAANKNGLAGLILGHEATASVQISTTTLTGTSGDVAIGANITTFPTPTVQPWQGAGSTPRDDFAFPQSIVPPANNVAMGPYYASYSVIL